MKPMDHRQTYDLSGLIMTVGRIGRLQPLQVLPVVAGDTVDISLDGNFRLSPLRRNLTVDAKLDFFAFFIPYRHIYGDVWMDFIRKGVDEDVTFPNGASVGSAVAECYGMRVPANTALPRWLTAGFPRIWNRYFRHPTKGGELPDTHSPSTVQARYGFHCGHLPTVWSVPVASEVTPDDFRADLQGGKVDLIDLARRAGRLKTERRREWFAEYYNNILKASWGGGANPDADERPYLIFRRSEWLSGYDVPGTDQASLGNYSGISAGRFSFRVPPRFFAEHGTLWLLALVRFPPILSDECEFLVKKPNPTYKEIACDPDIVRREPPFTLTGDMIFSRGSSGHSYGQVPFNQHYRYCPISFVHEDFFFQSGFPFIHETGSPTAAQAEYITDTEYDKVFSTLQLQHWHTQLRRNCAVKRQLPDVVSSIFAGSGLE